MAVIKVFFGKCDAVKTRSFISKVLTTDTPYLSREGELWGVFCEFKV